MALTPETLALAVINDGSTYEERKRLIKRWAETPSTAISNRGMAECRRGLRRMCVNEQRKPIYDGERLDGYALDAAAAIVEDYMAQHYAESNNGSDWS